MRIYNIVEVKKLKSDFTKLQKKSRHKAIEFIKERYQKEGGDFHRLFLHSGLIFALEPSEIQSINSVIIIENEKDTKIKKDLYFLNYLLLRKKAYEENITQLINLTEEGISIESIFNYLELLKYRIYVHNEPLSGTFRSEDEVEAHFEHILSCSNEIVELIRTNKVSPVSLDNIICSEETLRELFRLISRKKATQEKILSILLEITEVNIVENFDYYDHKIEKVYLTEYYIPFWREFEIYRDLNCSLFSQELSDEEELFLLKTSGSLRLFNSEIIYFDYNNQVDFNVEVDLYQAYKYLEPMYGTQNNEFDYKGKVFKIKDLLESYKKLLKVNYTLLKNADEASQCSILVLEEEAMLELSHIKHPELLHLLSINLDDSSEPSTLINYRPLIRKEESYYIVPSHIENTTIERCIDKILSNANTVNIRTEKGIFFENQIEEFFESMNLEYAQVSRDEKNGIPEIDGLFVLDDYVFIFEAKAMIKPESIIESSDCFESKVYKAFTQIVERLNVLNDPEKRRLIEVKTKVNFRGKKIAPFILMNHVYFNGYQGLYFTQGDETRHVPIIDFLTLKSLIMTKGFPTWKYNKKRNVYKPHIKKYQSAEQLYYYMLNQLNELVSSEETIYQLDENFILSPIAKSVRIL
ncbi:hypothetical protein M3629_00665 [Paenibacillus polysaccharolyticus]|uniref:hypothetical protein n=1 Tax=Paenibacillus polysaccharolyticus TaxID=582692 RepID=UPI0020414027|nr:hypothetical protein [Paenibacillus polysaccharolyticus]MCM3131276.1 hypothetical protein [Paenibacillus polysaccharolyticus]